MLHFLFTEEAIEKRKKILDEADIEEGKRDLITREIGKFRETMKVSCLNILTKKKTKLLRPCFMYNYIFSRIKLLTLFIFSKYFNFFQKFSIIIQT